MGSEIFCAVDSIGETQQRSAQQRLERVPAMFEAWEQALSRFRPESELSRLNERTGERVRVSETLWQVLELADRAEVWSDGLVTPTVLNALEHAGYDRSFETIDAGMPGRSLHIRMQAPAWQLHRASHQVTLSQGTRLDVGGVAKGWAAEQTANYLGKVGPALVDAGGDMVMTAPRADGSPWTIGIENPCEGMQPELPLLQIPRGAVATSGRDFRKWTHAGKAAHHLIDPRTALPAVTDVLTVTTVAPTIFQAEVAAKVALLLGSRKGMKWLEMHDVLAALFVLEDGTVLKSARIEKFL